MVEQNGQSTAVQRMEVEGFGHLLLRKDEVNAVKLVMKAVELQAGHHFYKIGNKGQMSAAGIDEKNRYAGCHILNPPVVIVDGVEQGNPYVETDSVSGTVRVLARKLIIGRTPFGEWVSVDYTADYIPAAYHRSDLLRVVSKTPEAGWLGGEEHGPAKDQKGRWRFVQTHADGIGIWIDLAHKEIQAVYETTDQRRLHALKIAQTIARRNGLAMHPAIGGQRFKLDEFEDTYKWGNMKGKKFKNSKLPDTKVDTVYSYVSRGTRQDAEDLAANVSAARTADIRVESVVVETADDTTVIEATFEQADTQAEAERMERAATVTPREGEQDEPEDGAEPEAEEKSGPDGRPVPPDDDEFGGWKE